MRFLTDLFRRYHIPYLLQAPDCYTIPQEGADGMREAVRENVSSPGIDPLSMLAPNMPDAVYFDPSIADHSEDYAGTDRILIGSSPVSVERLREMISPMGLKIEFASFKGPDPYSGEISPEGITKSTGMMELLQFLGRSQEDTVAFGDGPNDLEMMEFSACSVAMGNAIDSVKEKADLVTDDIGRDGLFKAMQQLNLI
jgi:hydroxymethylpyrimidine pyrophosphatase-like HAD family hydrolase